MNKWLGLTLCLICLTACATRSSVIAKADNAPDKINAMTCEQIDLDIALTHQRIEHLKEQIRLNNTSNAVNVGSALLSLNPFLLLQTGSNGPANESLATHEERLKLLAARQVVLSCANTISATSASAPATTSEIVR